MLAKLQQSVRTGEFRVPQSLRPPRVCVCVCVCYEWVVLVVFGSRASIEGDGKMLICNTWGVVGL